MKQNLLLFLLLLFFFIKLSKSQSQQVQDITNLTGRAKANFTIELVFQLPNDTQRYNMPISSTVYYGPIKNDLEKTTALRYEDQVRRYPGQTANFTFMVANKSESLYFGVKYSFNRTLMSNISNIIEITPSANSGNATRNVFFILLFFIGLTISI